MRTIDRTTWERAEHYNFFHAMDYPQYNICMDVDITNFLEKTKAKKLPFYYAMIYAAMNAANEVEEFRYRIHGEEIVVHDRLHPSFTDLTRGSELFKFVTVELEASMEEFVVKAKDKSEHQQRYLPFEEMSRDDLIYITCIPWISFTHLSHTINLRKDDAVPRISWGKYYPQGDKVLLPYSVQVNHALVDGVHVGKYVTKLQEYLDQYC
jgi:chloramphenicol O-acetyltransferase type A